MINPQIRMRRLRKDYELARQIHDKHGLIQIADMLGDPPSRYIIQYACRGIIQVINSQPVYGDLHRVLINLTESYPTSLPMMEWLTPIFHPNILPDGQSVCIGPWYPAKTLDQVIIMLGEMVQYKNYASHDPLFLEASLWAMNNKHLFPVDDRSLLDPGRTTPTSRRSRPQNGEIDISIIG
jgi:ubiquitin-protein ligase